MQIKRVTSRSELESVVKPLYSEREYTVVDIETVSPTGDPKDAKNPHKATPVDVQLLGGDGIIYVAAFEHASVLRMLDPRVVLVGQNFKYDLICLAKNGLDLTDYWWHDTMLLDALVDENAASHSLDNMVKRYFGKVEYKADFWEKYANYTDASEEERLLYGGQDIYWTNKVYLKLMEKLNAELN